MQTKGKKCIIKILICLRTQDVDLKNSLHLLWILNIDFVVWVTYKNFSNKANSHRCCHIRLTTQRGLGTIYTSGKLNELPPCLFVVWSIVLAECPLTCTCNMAMNREKEDIISFYTSGWKSLDGFKQEAQAMTYWWFVRIAQKLERRRRSQVDEKFPKIGACSSHESGGSQKFGKSVASATTFSIKDTLYCLKLMFSNKKKRQWSLVICQSLFLITTTKRTS